MFVSTDFYNTSYTEIGFQIYCNFCGKCLGKKEKHHTEWSYPCDCKTYVKYNTLKKELKCIHREMSELEIVRHDKINEICYKEELEKLKRRYNIKDKNSRRC